MRPERVILIIQPFARLTLAELLSRLSPGIRLVVFHQILEGVHALHSARPAPLVHRDLKLANIGIISYNDQTITIAILDYGQTIQAQLHSPAGGKAGTPGYQASKMQLQDHSTALDVWSCGIIGLRLFVPEWQHSPNERADFQKGVAMLGGHDPTMPRNLLAGPLAWEPNERISASDALLHPCFSSVANEPSSPTPPARKRHRQEA